MTKQHSFVATLNTLLNGIYPPLYPLQFVKNYLLYIHNHLTIF